MSESRREKGSAIVMAVFALALLTGMGTALLFLSQHEARMGQTNVRARQAFYLAEAGLEDGRITLFEVNTDGDLDDDLATAAGADGILDFDPQNLDVTFASDGSVSGLTGFDDDTPIRPLTALVGSAPAGSYAAFLTNDPLEGISNLVDDDGRVMLTAVGVGERASTEMVQAIVEPWRFVPELPSAAITMLGPLPSFDNGNSNAQDHDGSDCGVVGGPHAPIVGAIGGAAAAQIKADMNRPETFESGAFLGQDTIGDLTDPADPIVASSGHGTIESAWTDCATMKSMILNLMYRADYYCNSDLGACSLPSAAAPDDIVFVDGDLSGTPAGPHSGILVITGHLIYNGNTGWDGVILAIGEGSIERSGGGTGNPSGAVVMAAIDPTPDGPRVEKDDWCSTSPDGFGQATYTTSGAGNSTVQWCSSSITNSNSIRTYRVVEFLQR